MLCSSPALPGHTRPVPPGPSFHHSATIALSWEPAFLSTSGPLYVPITEPVDFSHPGSLASPPTHTLLLVIYLFSLEGDTWFSPAVLGPDVQVSVKSLFVNRVAFVSNLVAQ